MLPYHCDERSNSGMYVRVMCDHCADGLWADDGISVAPKDYPISDDLSARIYAWQAEFERLDGEATLAFCAEGRAIAVAFKRELPECKVVYYDDLRGREHGGDRTYFEYEIDLVPDLCPEDWTEWMIDDVEWKAHRWIEDNLPPEHWSSQRGRADDSWPGAPTWFILRVARGKDALLKMFISEFCGMRPMK